MGELLRLMTGDVVPDRELRGDRMPLELYTRVNTGFED